MRKKFAWVLAPAIALLLLGCFDIEQGVQLNKDFSGTTTLNFIIDMEPMALVMASMEKAFSGDETPLTAQEVEAARAKFLAQQESGEGEDLALDRDQAEAQLPDGVRLVSFEPVQDGLRFGARMKLEFDHYSKLQQIDFGGDDGDDADEAPAMGPPKPDALERPFAGLVFTDEGDTMLVTSPAENPLDKLQEENPLAGQETGELADMMAKSFESLRFVTSLTLPFEILEHNATRVDGSTLWWEYDLASFETATPEQLAEGVRVRFKK